MKSDYQSYTLKRNIFVWVSSCTCLCFICYIFLINSLRNQHQETRNKTKASFQSFAEDFHKITKHTDIPSIQELESKQKDFQALKLPAQSYSHSKDLIKKLKDLTLIAKYYKTLKQSTWTEVEQSDLKNIFQEQQKQLTSTFEALSLKLRAIEIKQDKKKATQNRFEQTTLLLFICLFPLLILYLYKELKKAFRSPVEALLTGAEQMRAGNLDHVLNVKEAAQDDFGQLMRNFNMMARRISSMTAQLEQANHALQGQSDNFEESAKQKVKFIRQLGHELRAPLSSIIGFSEMLKEGYYGEIADKQKSYVERIHRSGEALLSMVNDLVDQAKLQSGNWRLEFDRYDIYALLEEVYLEFEITAERAGVTLLFDEKSVPKLPAIIDRKLIRQLMVNLITNALKFSDKLGEVTLSLKELSAKKSWRFSVIDNGLGIPENELSKIFDEFHQIESSYSSKGAGLGLPLCKKIAEMHSGKITVSSTPGEGSQFNLIIPVDPQTKKQN